MQHDVRGGKPDRDAVAGGDESRRPEQRSPGATGDAGGRRSDGGTGGIGLQDVPSRATLHTRADN